MGWGPPGIVVLIALVGFAVLGLMHVNGSILLLRSRCQNSNEGSKAKPLVVGVFFLAISMALILDIVAIFLNASRVASETTPRQVAQANSAKEEE